QRRAGRAELHRLQAVALAAVGVLRRAEIGDCQLAEGVFADADAAVGVDARQGALVLAGVELAVLVLIDPDLVRVELAVAGQAGDLVPLRRVAGPRGEDAVAQVLAGADEGDPRVGAVRD